MKITYHKATEADVDILASLRILFALELSGEQSSNKINLLKEQLLHYFMQATAEGTCISVIAKCGEVPVGIGSVHLRAMPANFKNPTGKWGYIMNMYTLPAYRRKGICREILNVLIEEGKKKGITAYELHATQAGEPVYKQSGFEKHGEPTYRKFI